MSDGSGHPFQPDPERITWKVHFHASPDVVYEFLADADKRKQYWAVSADETDGLIHYRFLNDIETTGRILASEPGRLFTVEYFGTVTSFELASCDDGGCDMQMSCAQFDQAMRTELIAGWVSWLLTMRAAVDFGVDLRNHDAERTWIKGFADN